LSTGLEKGHQDQDHTLPKLSVEFQQKERNTGCGNKKIRPLIQIEFTYQHHIRNVFKKEGFVESDNPGGLGSGKDLTHEPICQ